MTAFNVGDRVRRHRGLERGFTEHPFVGTIVDIFPSYCAIRTDHAVSWAGWNTVCEFRYESLILESRHVTKTSQEAADYYDAVTA
jgi:hypothetical protein